MSLPSEETQVKSASEGAQAFVESYYHSLSSASPISHFYINSSKSYSHPAGPSSTATDPAAAPLVADISINGSVLPLPTDYERLVADHGPGTRYEVESFDAHSVNPAFALADPAASANSTTATSSSGPSDRSGSRMSLLVQVTGRVHFGKGRDSVRKPFNEVFVLVPNWEALSRNAPRNLRRWLIMSQNFRTL